jgi:hypothetical protein
MRGFVRDQARRQVGVLVRIIDAIGLMANDEGERASLTLPYREDNTALASLVLY